MDARKIDDSEQLVHLGSGMLHVAKNDLKSAREEFLKATKVRLRLDVEAMRARQN